MQPFVFMSSVESVQLTGRKAASLLELFLGLEASDGAVVYHHTHRFYRSYSYLGPWDRSDFALWVGQVLKEEALAERLGAVDPRDFTDLAGFKDALLGILGSLLEEKDRWSRRVPAGLEFHFCRAVSLVFPTGHEARNLEEFAAALARVDLASLYYHMIEAPLHHREKDGYPNDPSRWLAAMGFPQMAEALARVDPYRGDLEGLRADLLRVLKGPTVGSALRHAVNRIGREPAGEPAALWLKQWREGR